MYIGLGVVFYAHDTQFYMVHLQVSSFLLVSIPSAECIFGSCCAYSFSLLCIYIYTYSAYVDV